MIIYGMGHAMRTMADKNKGSLTNRYQCAQEHFKNDLNLTLKEYAAATAAGGAVFATAAKNGTKAAKFVETVFTKPVGMLIKTGMSKLAKATGASPEVLTKFTKLNPAKLGAAGIFVAAGLSIIGALISHANKRGKIDQKYDDAAKIESQTKNVVLAEKEDQKAATASIMDAGM